MRHLDKKTKQARDSLIARLFYTCGLTCKQIGFQVRLCPGGVGEVLRSIRAGRIKVDGYPGGNRG